MKLKSNDSLQLLLREAMHQQKVTVSPPSLKPTVILKQCERLNEWTTTHPVALIHRSPEGKETYLGAFDVQVSSLFKARRFVPSQSTSHGKLPREIVKGDYWLHLQVAPATEDTLQEVTAIEARFKELMNEFKDIV